MSELMTNTVLAGGPIYIDGPAGNLHIRDLGGSGPVILAMHGVTGCTYIWDGVAKGLIPNFHFLAFDYRGHGKSHWSETQDYSTDAYADDLETAVAWVAGQTNQPLILMGSSWGALAMLKLMERRPSNIHSLIIVDVEPSFEASEYAVQPRPYRFESFESVMEWERKANPSAPELQLKDFAHGSVVRTEEGAYVRRHDPFFLTRWPFRNDYLWLNLSQIDVPALVLNGDRSFVKEEVCREMVKQLPQGEYIKVKDSGHLVPLEQPAAVSEQVNRFLEKTLIK